MTEQQFQIQFRSTERKIVHLWMFSGIIPYITPLIGTHFIVSPWWTDKCQAIAYVFGVFAGAFFLWFSSRRVQLQLLDEPKSMAIFFIALPVANFFFGWTFVMASIPMASAIAAGGRTHLSLSVYDPSVSHRSCRNGVSFEGATFLFNDACNVPKSVLDRLEQGDTVDVTGWGTGLGVFNPSLKSD